MYPPPPREVIATLVGQTVEVVSFGKYVLHVSFGTGDRLGIACPFRFASSEGIPESSIQEFPLQASNLLRVLGTAVQAAETESDGTLHLEFANGDCLIAYANEPRYEAYTLFVGGREYVV